MSAKILVFGSTGSVGKEVCQALAAKNVPFRAAVRDLKKGEEIKKLGSHVELAELDVYNAASVEKALVGIEKVFLLTPPGQTSSAANFVEPFKKAGIKNVVKLSALGAEETDPTKFVWAAEHKGIEDLFAKNGISVTSLRPSGFHTNFLHDIDNAKNKGLIFKPFNTPMNWVSNRDIAEVAAKALTEEGHEGKVYNLTGNDTFTTEEYAKVISEALGKEVKFVQISYDDLRKNMTFLDPASLNSFVNMMTYFEHGGYNRTFPDAKNILGREPRSLKDYINSVVKH